MQRELLKAGFQQKRKSVVYSCRMERFKMIASGYAFFIKKNKILLSQRKNTGYMDGWFSLPAGHIENNESLTKGTIREIHEETGIVLSDKDITLVHVMHRKSDDIRMDFFFLVNRWKGIPKNTEEAKCSAMEWFPLTALPPNTIPYIKEAISQYQSSSFFSEFGW